MPDSSRAAKLSKAHSLAEHVLHSLDSSDNSLEEAGCRELTDNLKRRADAEGWPVRLVERIVDDMASEPLPQSVWEVTLSSVFAEASAEASDQDLVWPSALRFVLSSLIRSTANKFREQLVEAVKGFSQLPFTITFATDQFMQHLESRLSRCISRVLVLELNIARLQGTLRGANSEDRYRDFFRMVRVADRMTQLFADYPVLARDLNEQAALTLAADVDLYTRLAADWPNIVTTFAKVSPSSTLVRVEPDLGDPHRGGRSVASLHFTNNCVLIYKPRSLGADQAFNALLGWVNTFLTEFPLRLLDILDMRSHGWTECVEQDECASADQVNVFYRRFGRLLCVLYALHATDFHYGNLIAAGPQPVLIDLEGLFHGTARHRADALSEEPSLLHSVLMTGLLPSRLPYEQALDTSGIGGMPGQSLPWEARVWDGLDSDQLNVRKAPAHFQGGKNRPRLGDEIIEPLTFLQDIIAGFQETYRLLQRNKEQLLVSGGLLDSFAHCELRAIIRPTNLYAQILSDLRHPDNLRNALNRDVYLAKLWDVPSLKSWECVARAESADLFFGDIPYFLSAPISRDVWTSQGQCISNFLERSGLSLSRMCVAKMSNDDCNLQIEMLSAAISSLSSSIHAVATPIICKRLPQALPKDPFLLGLEVAQLLAQSAITTAAGTTWLGLSLKEGSYISVETLGLDLYSGLPGICLFLSSVTKRCPDERLNQLAHNAVLTLSRRVSTESGSITCVGGYSGFGGLLTTFRMLDGRWPELQLLQQCENIVARAAELISSDRYFDLVYGSAGLLSSLLALYKFVRSDAVLLAATKCGDHLLHNMVDSQDACGWLTPMSPKKVLSGYSHGSAGIIAHLYALGQLVNDSRYTNAAEKALRFERTLYSPSERNWRDRRVEFNGTTSSMKAWCHGSAGIGFSRLKMAKLRNDPELDDEITIAVETTLGSFGSNHSLCHGDLGNLEFCSAAAEHLGREALTREVESTRQSVLESMSARGFICGNPGGIKSPGLMTGLSGIGYGLLRLADPEHTPSVLC